MKKLNGHEKQMIDRPRRTATAAANDAIEQARLIQAERLLHAEMKRLTFLLLKDLGIDPVGKSLAVVMNEARERARLVAQSGEHLASFAAYVGGAADALKFGKSDDINRARALLDRADKEIELATIKAKGGK